MAGLAELLREQGPLLDSCFGAGVYQIADMDDEAATIRTASVEVTLSYSWRDRWITSEIKSLGVPEKLRESHPTHAWLRFLGERLPPRRKGGVDDQQLREELLLVRRLMTDVFADDRRARDGAAFCDGYVAAYNDYYSGLWDTQS